MKSHFLKTRLFHLLLTLFCLTVNTHAQSTGNIKGSITNNVKAPLPHVNIILAKTNFNTITNGQGKYFINNIPAGNYYLIISHIGYQSIKRDIIVKENETAEYSYALQDSTIEIAPVEVYGEERITNPARLPEISGTNIYSGKKMKYSCLTV